MRFNPPPNWPPPPPGWTPPPGWQPDPQWGPPPPDWQLWIDDALIRRQLRKTLFTTFGGVVGGFMLVLALVAVVGGDGDRTTASPKTVTTASVSPTPSSDPSVTQTGGATPTARPTTAESRWYPKAYKEWEEGLAFRWARDSEYQCDFGGRCNAMFWIAREGCGNFYVALSVLDRRTVVGYTNDAVGSMHPMQKAKLVFHISEDDATRVEISEVSCY